MSVCLQDILYFSIDREEFLRAAVKLTLVEKWSLRCVIAELRLALGVWR
jgi:hypothetical protein